MNLLNSVKVQSFIRKSGFRSWVGLKPPDVMLGVSWPVPVLKFGPLPELEVSYISQISLGYLIRLTFL